MRLPTVEENIQRLNNLLAYQMRSRGLHSSENDEPDMSSGPVGVNLWSPEVDRRKPK
jgi:hypothetical protein